MKAEERHGGRWRGGGERAHGACCHLSGGGTAGVLGPHAAAPTLPRPSFSRCTRFIQNTIVQTVVSASPTGLQPSSGVARFGSHALLQPGQRRDQCSSTQGSRGSSGAAARGRELRAGRWLLASCRWPLVAAAAPLLPPLFGPSGTISSMCFLAAGAVVVGGSRRDGLHAVRATVWRQGPDRKQPVHRPVPCGLPPVRFLVCPDRAQTELQTGTFFPTRRHAMPCHA